MRETKYGLPERVVFCKRCVISNQRPNSQSEFNHVTESKKQTIHFDEEGVCDACRVAEAKGSINWDERERELKDLCDRHRKFSGGYDCVVPGSGGKDSFYAAHILRTRYKMHPLLVTWASHIYTEWGSRNLSRWQEIADHILVTPKRGTHRLLTRLAVETLCHPFQPFIIGQKTIAPRISALYNIPLVFYGEDEAEYGNPRASVMQPLRDVSYWTAGKDIYLSGVHIDELKGRYGLTTQDLIPYLPQPRDMANKTEVHYLGYYLRWKPQSCYYYAVENGGFEASPERTPGTYSKYNSIDDKVDDLHYYTTYIKFGIGRATYDASQEIRSLDITRDEGLALVRRFDGEWPARFEKDLWEYLSVPEFPPASKGWFLDLAEKFKSPHLWNGSELRHTVWGAELEIEMYEADQRLLYGGGR